MMSSSLAAFLLSCSVLAPCACNIYFVIDCSHHHYALPLAPVTCILFSIATIIIVIIVIIVIAIIILNPTIIIIVIIILGIQSKTLSISSGGNSVSASGVENITVRGVNVGRPAFITSV